MDFSLLDMWEKMGTLAKAVNIFMALMSIWSLYVIVERWITFYKGSRQSYSYVLALRDYLGKRKVDEALSAARKHGKSPVAKVVESGLAAYKGGREALDTTGPADVGEFDLVDSVNRSLERVKEREIANLRKGLGGLATIASIAPFVGLFGTVIGIINSFQKLKEGGGIEVIGPGISEALVSTAFGLLVAIPAAIAFNYFTGRVEAQVVDMSDVSSEFIDYVLKEGRA
ncbi:MAG TPA: MotA/TolQ/ExbB proton channel family protein [Kofleriaceae bacterium]|nr:MotA/TolQ/ExbB proton channel family protein [Kofleriaceae bacterium]